MEKRYRESQGAVLDYGREKAQIGSGFCCSLEHTDKARHGLSSLLISGSGLRQHDGHEIWITGAGTKDLDQIYPEHSTPVSLHIKTN